MKNCLYVMNISRGFFIIIKLCSTADECEVYTTHTETLTHWFEFNLLIKIECTLNARDHQN